MNLDKVVLGCEVNVPKYWQDSYLNKNKTRILRVMFEDKKNVYLITEETIFHPKYGGQPSDKGRVYNEKFVINVNKTMKYKGIVILYGKVEVGEPKEGEVTEEIDWSTRYLMMRRHTASHLFDHALEVVTGSKVETIDSWLGDSWYISFKGSSPGEELLRNAVELENKIIAEGYAVSTRLVDRSRMLEEAKDSPNLARLPELDFYRIVKINGFEDIACSGTHLKNIAEIGNIEYVRSETVSEGFKVYLNLL
ncbi:MAG: alanyl-tRNA editing protein [Nitrososphaeria archaeon]